MMTKLLYSDVWNGLKLVAKNGAQLRTDPAIVGYGVHMNPNPGEYVICTGFFYQQSDDVFYYQTTSDWWIIANSNVANEWSKAGTVKVRAYSVSQAQRLVDTIIDNNKRIIRNNLLCARFASKLSSKQREQVVQLQNRLQARNNALQAEGVTKNIKTSYPRGYAELSQDLEALMRSEAVGVIGTAAWIVISCVVVAGMGVAAYYMYKSLAEESEKDVKFSDDLTRTLTSKLTEEEYQQLLQETKGIVTKARVKHALGSYWNVLKIAAFAVAGYAGYRFIKNYWMA